MATASRRNCYAFERELVLAKGAPGAGVVPFDVGRAGVELLDDGGGGSHVFKGIGG